MIFQQPIQIQLSVGKWMPNVKGDAGRCRFVGEDFFFLFLKAFRDGQHSQVISLAPGLISVYPEKDLDPVTLSNESPFQVSAANLNDYASGTTAKPENKFAKLKKNCLARF